MPESILKSSGSQKDIYPNDDVMSALNVQGSTKKVDFDISQSDMTMSVYDS